jgi:hypothetical protein
LGQFSTAKQWMDDSKDELEGVWKESVVVAMFFGVY